MISVAKVLAIGVGALLNFTSGSYDIAIGDGAGSKVEQGSCVILIGTNVDVPTPGTSNYINVDGTVYPNSARSEPWLQALARRRAHELVDRMTGPELSGGQPLFFGSRESVHRAIDSMSFYENECAAESTS